MSLRLRGVRALSVVPLLLGLFVTASPAAASPPVAGAPDGIRAAVEAIHAPGEGEATRLRSVNRWLVDPEGRAVRVHGINLVLKRAPYYPAAAGFGPDDVALLKRSGFTAVRLGLFWSSVEPSPGQYDDAYLARVRQTARLLAAEGIWVLLDLHQDMWNERYQGHGAPDWATLDNGLPAYPAPGFPVNYFVTPGLNAAFDSFLLNRPAADGVGLQDHYASMAQHVASFFADESSILGFDLMNEPWPGTTWPICVLPLLGCPLQDQLLQRFHERVIAAVRAVDTRTTLFYEPYLTFNSGIPTHQRPAGANLGFSFHTYCIAADGGLPLPDPIGDLVRPPVCDVGYGMTFDNASAHVRASGDAPLMSEFGATNDLVAIADVRNRTRARGFGWMYWAFEELVADPSLPPTGENLDEQKLRALVEPYGVAFAGTPRPDTWDPAAKILTVGWTNASVETGRPFTTRMVSTIAVPTSVYPHGYRVVVSGGKVVSAPDAPVLEVSQAAAATEIKVTVVPR